MAKKAKTTEKDLTESILRGNLLSPDDLHMWQSARAQVNGAAQALQAAQAAQQFVEGTLLAKYKVAAGDLIDVTTGEITRATEPPPKG